MVWAVERILTSICSKALGCGGEISGMQGALWAVCTPRKMSVCAQPQNLTWN